MITYREANLQDIPHIQSVAQEVWPETFGPLMSAAQLNYMMGAMYSTQSLYQQMNDLGHRYLLAFEGDKALAYCAYELYFRMQNQVMMHKLYLRPSAQGKGIGSALLEQLMHIASHNHQESIRLQVLHSNQKAYHFYQKKGFQKTGEEYNVLGDDMGRFLDFVMTKAVPKHAIRP